MLFEVTFNLQLLQASIAPPRCRIQLRLRHYIYWLRYAPRPGAQSRPPITYAARTHIQRMQMRCRRRRRPPDPLYAGIYSIALYYYKSFQYTHLYTHYAGITKQEPNTSILLLISCKGWGWNTNYECSFCAFKSEWIYCFAPSLDKFMRNICSIRKLDCH